MNTTNTNSFAGGLATLTKNANEMLSIIEGMNESMSGVESEVQINDELTLPSFTNIIKRVERAENTVSKFVQGKGVVETDDGTFRKIKVSTISKPPMDITNLPDVSTFGIDANWFFESLQYPRCVIKLDLTNSIEESSDRVFVNRVIIDTYTTAKNGDNGLTFYRNNILGNLNLGYSALINLLETSGVAYKEDKSEVALPLTFEKYTGEYFITDIKLIKDENGKSQQWYYLDNVTYSSIDENGLINSSGYVLKPGDMLRFNDSLYKITDVVANQRRIKLDYAVGFESLGLGDKLEFYNEPFSEKVISVGIGINEINVVYVKGVNEDYNLLSKSWSRPISFYTNELVFDEEENKTFEEYYKENVADFGYQWIMQAKEKQIYSLQGIKPNAPVLNESDLAVVQINTQLDATLDKESYNKLTSEIASTKSNISATRSTIASNKDKLIQSSNADDRLNIQNTINSDTDTLNSLTTQYSSLVNELNTLLNESGAINYSPKYHIRGFFGIPEPKYNDVENKLGAQVIIGFEVMYRYLHTDETGIKLNTYEYVDTNNIIQTGVFTDWNIMQSSLLSKSLNEDTGLYEWVSENTADGSKININQIDIPIQSGEKVELKVRSISEAGYPYNPLKSDWSNSIIVSFPDNLTADDNVSTLLDTVKSDVNAIVLQETLSAAGVYSHSSDSNSIYKHTSKNVSYTNKKDGNNVVEMSVQDKIDTLDLSIGVLSANVDLNNTNVNSKLNTIDTSLAIINNTLKASELYNTEFSSIQENITSLANNDNIIVDVLNKINEELKGIKEVLGYTALTMKDSDEQLKSITSYNANVSKIKLPNKETEKKPAYIGAYTNIVSGMDTLAAYITQIAESFGLTLSK